MKKTTTNKKVHPASSRTAKAPTRAMGVRAPIRARRERSDDANAFIPDPGEGPVRTSDDLAEVLGEDFVAAVTSGNEVLDDDLGETLPDELGGPFVITSAREELASGIDESNPADAEVEGFPRAIAGLVQQPPGEESAANDGSDEEDESTDTFEDKARRPHPR